MIIPDYKNWENYASASPAKIDGIVFECLEAEFYKKTVDDTEWSCGVFSKNGNPIMMAWGPKLSKHCSSHALMINKIWSKPIPGCPDALRIMSGDQCVGASFKYFAKTIKF